MLAKLSRPLISIVVPVFNVETYLSTCIDSIIAQSYDNIEIILVDDGSKDNSGLICDNYAFKHDNIKVIHKKNGGVSTARNAGISASRGDFISFVDGDDTINHRMIEILYNDIESSGADISSVGLTSHYSLEEVRAAAHSSIANLKEKTMLSSEESVRLVLEGKTVSSCARLYRRSSIKDVRFAAGRRYNEDKYFIFECFLTGYLFSFREEKLYYVLNRPDSSSGRKNVFTRDTPYFSRLMIDKVTEKMPQLTQLAKKNDLITRLGNLHYLFRKTLEKQERVKLFREIRSEIMSYDKETWKNMDMKYKVEKIVLNFGYHLYGLCVICFDYIKYQR